MLTALVLAALGLSALAVIKGLPLRAPETAANACDSCDARHQNHLRLVARRAAETTP
jgi:hypothetical protein